MDFAKILLFIGSKLVLMRRVFFVPKPPTGHNIKKKGMRFMCSCPSTCGFCKTLSGTGVIEHISHAWRYSWLYTRSSAKHGCSLLPILLICRFTSWDSVAMLFSHTYNSRKRMQRYANELECESWKWGMGMGTARLSRLFSQMALRQDSLCRIS